MQNAADVAAKWVQNTSNAGAAMKSGAMGVTVSPTAVAAQHLDRYQAGVLAAVSSGRMAKALNDVSLNDWQQAYITKGIAHMPLGVQQAKPKMQAFMESWLPKMDTLKSRIAQMPKGGLADSQARAAFAIQFSAQQGKRFAGA